MSKATALYVRVSHRDQTHASQLPDLERWTAAKVSTKATKGKRRKGPPIIWLHSGIGSSRGCHGKRFEMSSFGRAR